MPTVIPNQIFTSTLDINFSYQLDNRPINSNFTSNQQTSSHFRFTGNGQEVYFPQPWFANYRGRSRSELPAGMRIQRTNVLIGLPMYSLRDLCLRTIKRILRNDRQALNLEIPASLRQELYHMHPRKPDLQDREQGEQVQEEQR